MRLGVNQIRAAPRKGRERARRLMPGQVWVGMPRRVRMERPRQTRAQPERSCQAGGAGVGARLGVRGWGARGCGGPGRCVRSGGRWRRGG